MSISEILGTALKAWGNSFAWIGGFIDNHERAITAAATIAIAAFTWALWLSTRRLWQETKAASGIAKDSAEAALKTATVMEHSERAYVKMTHLPPGLRFGQNQEYWVQMRIKNYGRTPARVTTRCMCIKYFAPGENPPSIPDYSRDGVIDTVGAFLVSDDHIGNQLQGAFPGSEIESAARAGQGRLLVWGYVDYINQFGRHHRAGYGREYSATLDDPSIYPWDDFPKRSNLAFVPEPNYNYDRERRQDDGTDWDQPN